MSKRIEISLVEVPNEEEWRKKITEILSEGIYAYLKNQGLLRENSTRSEKIKLLLEKTKKISNYDDDKPT